MTLTHILCTGAMIAAGIVALVAIVISFRESWHEFLDALEGQDR
ncbi:hypothetical protein ACFSTI_20855 [Rhizorhabdus histidinilytica]|uniref:Uncharacterized protein n=1 Tax=Rhizorhabdus histidinilytica TaxID=439228 RepID=A0A1T5BN56_9SPHN|nr:hypothetical protein [Rhizorhabdus histidinilytica]SKB48575.1 hypothetical protein SAMN06295920_103137 [Rhizorhabdus histidinilytica]